MADQESRRPFLVALAALAAAGCGAPDTGSDAEAEPHVVELTAVELKLEGPNSTPAGWTTIRLVNQSDLVHFAWLGRYPDGRGVADHQADVAPIYQEGMDLLNAGDTEAALAKFSELPEWAGDVVAIGGPGFVSPGHSTEVTTYLEPGTYLVECYVKTGGIFHSVNPDPDAYGMVHELTVTPTEASTDVEAGAGPPPIDPTIAVSISSEGGIVVGARDAGTVSDPPGADEPTVSAGDHLVAVEFLDQTSHENYLGHDVHVARIGEDTDLVRLGAWMDWRAAEGLETPAPAEFVGGIHDLPAGATGYFSVTLEPGVYAWIAEVPDPSSKGMLQTFTVR